MNKLHHGFQNNISLTTATYIEQERVGGNDKRRTDEDKMRKRRQKKVGEIGAERCRMSEQVGVHCYVHGHF